MRRVAFLWLRRLGALLAAFVVGTWVIVIAVGAPLGDALWVPFAVLVPVGLVPIGAGLGLILILRRYDLEGPAGHMAGAAALPFATVVLMRLVLGGEADLAGLFVAPMFVLLLFVAGAVSGLVLWQTRRWLGDL